MGSYSTYKFVAITVNNCIADCVRIADFEIREIIYYAIIVKVGVPINFNVETTKVPLIYQLSFYVTVRNYEEMLFQAPRNIFFKFRTMKRLKCRTRK